jgi:hypothetical protein
LGRFTGGGSWTDENDDVLVLARDGSLGSLAGSFAGGGGGRGRTCLLLTTEAKKRGSPSIESSGSSMTLEASVPDRTGVRDVEPDSGSVSIWFTSLGIGDPTEEDDAEDGSDTFMLLICASSRRKR